MAFAVSLDSQCTSLLTIYATSSFSSHSLVSTVAVVQGVLMAVVKPPMAKIADVFGRLEAFSLSMFIYVIGYIQMAGSNNVRTYASAQIFYAAGFTGLQILQQVFVADTTNLLNRALFSSLPDTPFLVTVWIGPLLASSILENASWRWGYGLWAIILPVAFLPLALSLFLNQRRAERMKLMPQLPWKGKSITQALKSLWYELDVMGILLLTAAFSLILIPLTLAASEKDEWRNASIVAMLVTGCVCLVVFTLWEVNSFLAPKPLVSLRLLRNRTVMAGCGIAFFYFMAFYLSVYPYFYSYLQVVQGQSVAAAGHITQTFSFSATVASVVISFAIKYTKHYKYFVLGGSGIYLMGIGLMIRYRTEASTTGQIVGAQIVVGIGGGMLNVPAQLGVQASAKHQDVAAATALFLTVINLGGAVGSAISGAIWTANVPAKLEQYLPVAPKNEASKIFGSIVTAMSYPAGSLERTAINRAYQETMDKLLLVAVCMCIPLIPLSLSMQNYNLSEVSSEIWLRRNLEAADGYHD
ncbi:MAG: hypothetical protein M1840_006913 [Geoglossum simile]|nr:MAG: hypothetical protein M1840_006913 [Geoglossum simile]